MKRSLLLLIFLVMVIVGCGMKKEDVYYPKSHYTQMTLDQADKKVIYVDWGNPLVYAGRMQTNSEVVKGKTNEVVYVLVQKKDTKEKGWVNLSSVIKNPVAKATLLNTTQIYKTPNEVSREFFTMVAPMIGYVMEIQEGWARVQWYMAAYKTFTGKSDWTTYEWVKLSDISTNADEADLLSLAYVSYQKMSEWETKWPTITAEKQKSAISNEIEKEIFYLENVIKKYGGAYGKVVSVSYVANIVELLRSLIYPPLEDEYTEESYDGEEMREEY